MNHLMDDAWVLLGIIVYLVCTPQRQDEDGHL